MKKLLISLIAIIAISASVFFGLRTFPVFGDTINTLSQWKASSTPAIIVPRVANMYVGLNQIASTTPTGSLQNGLLFYDTSSNKFRCREAGSWTNCIGSGGGSLSGGINGFATIWNSGTTVTTGTLRDNGTVAGVNATSSTASFNVQGTGTLNPFVVASSTGSKLLTVSPTGNIGIGTATPSEILDIYQSGGGKIKLEGAANYTTSLEDGNGALLISSSQTATSKFRLLPFTNDLYFQNTNSAGNINFTGLNGATLTGSVNFLTSALNVSYLTGSQLVGTDSSKNLVSIATTGTGSAVLQTSPTLITPILGVASGTALTLSNNLWVTGTSNLSGTVTLPGGATASSFISGTWIDLPTTGPSAIGTGGAGVNPMVAYVASANQYFTGAATGDIAYRDTSGKLLFGNTSGNPDMALSGGNLGIGNIIPAFKLDVTGTLRVTATSTLATTTATKLITTGNATLGSITASNITGSTQCLHADTNGNITGTSSDCGSGGGAVKLPTYTVCASGCDYTTIQAGLNQSNAVGGANIYLTDSTYTISATTTYPSNTVLQGNTYGTTLNVNAGNVSTVFKASTTSVSAFTIKHLQISNTGTAGLGVAIDGSNAAENIYEDMQINGFGTALKISDTANNTFYNVARNLRLFTNNICIDINGTTPTNDNSFYDIRCAPRTGGGGPGLRITRGQNNVFYNLNVEPGTGTGITGIALTTANTINTQFYGLYLEANATNMSIGAGVLRTSIVGGMSCCSTTAEVSDSGTDTTFLNFDKNFGSVATNQFGVTNILDSNFAQTGLYVTNNTNFAHNSVDFVRFALQNSSDSSNLLALGNPGTGNTLIATTSSATQLILTSAGRLGVNIASPGATLDVKGLAGNINAFNVASSTGTSMFTILPNGNVGVGTSSPAKLFEVWGSQAGGVARITRDVGTGIIPSQVYGTYDVAAYTSSSTLTTFPNLTGAAQTFSIATGSNPSIQRNVIGDLYVARDGNDQSGIFAIRPYANGSASNEVLYLDGFNGLGGINTSTPAAKFAVQGQAGLTAPLFSVASSTNASVFSVAAGGDILFSGVATSTTALVVKNPSGQAVLTIDTTSIAASPSSFILTVASSTSDKLFTIDGFGNERLKGLLFASSTAPTIATSTGAGTAATASLTGGNSSGEVTVNALTSPATSAVVVTITPNVTAPNKLICTFTPSNNAAAALSGTTQVNATSTASTWGIVSGTAALTTGTTYKWFYTCGGY